LGPLNFLSARFPDWGSTNRGALPVTIGAAQMAIIEGPEREQDLVALDDALQSLAILDPRKSRVVELRFFGGLSVEESAEVLSVSVDTVMRDWKLAKVWLLRELSKSSEK
jgi:RNA polymerase sigma factor (sigma-70 family)